MFGLSLAELIVIFVVVIIFVKPQDLPEIAHFLGKLFYRVKKLVADAKNYLKSAENELGLDGLRQDINRGIADEKSKIEEDITVIIDMHGNEHKVPNVQNLRSDLTSEALDEEVSLLNKENLNKQNYKKDELIEKDG